jgi:Fur family transcriptional regulator, ferric uptake regulator
MPNHNAALTTDALAATASHYTSVDALLSAHGLRRTQAARVVLAWLLANPDTSYTHAQLQLATQDDHALALDRVTLYRLIDRLTQVGLLLCRVDANRVRRYQAMPASVQALPHFECQTCHRDQPFTSALQSNTNDLEKAAQTALQALKALGYQGLSMDFAVRGVCADCATETPGTVVVNPTETPGTVVVKPTEPPGAQPAPAELPHAVGA